jgi:glycosyltransferase involved in cell wall biosynthesis
MQKLEDLKVIISTHEYFKGSGQELKEFLINRKINQLIYIAHKLFLANPNFSYKEVYKDGELISDKKSPIVPKYQILLYIRDAFYNLFFILFSKGRFDYYIGINSFNAFFGILFKKLGKVDKVVFFTIDYIMADRFDSGIMNKIYIWLDRFAFFNSDYTWNVSNRMSNQRVKEIGDVAKQFKQLVVPIGVPIHEAEIINVKRKNNIIVYSGELAPMYGLELIIKSARLLIDKFPDLEIRIIGDGKLKSKLQDLAVELGVDNHINFMGYINTTVDRTRWLSLLKESTLGIATYEKDQKSFKQFSDVTKPKDYMSCGLPVITTDVIPLSEDIKKYNLGRVIEDNVESFVTNVSELLKNEQEINKIRENIKGYTKDMTWENIFKRVFSEMGIKI